MENDKKRKKVIDKLDRMKEIVESYLDSNSPSEDPYEYARYKVWNSLINNALDFVRDDMIKYGKCDYSTSESFIKSIEKCCAKQAFSIIYKNVYSNFDTTIIYIGTVIDGINSGNYPTNYSEIFKGVG